MKNPWLDKIKKREEPKEIVLEPFDFDVTVSIDDDYIMDPIIVQAPIVDPAIDINLDPIIISCPPDGSGLLSNVVFDPIVAHNGTSDLSRITINTTWQQ